QPFVSLDTLGRAMSALRLTLGRRLRLGPPMASRTLEILDFVEEERAREAENWKTIPWTRLVRRWDRRPLTERNGWGYGGDRRNFRRDYERACRPLIGEFLSPRDRQEAYLEARESNTQR